MDTVKRPYSSVIPTLAALAYEAYNRRTRRRIDFDQVVPRASTARRQPVRQGQTETMSRTVQNRGDQQLVTSSRYNRVSKRTRYQAQQDADNANKQAVVWSWKGLGKPWTYGFYNAQKYNFADTGSYTAAPCWVVDLTSTPNLTGANLTNLRCPCPMYRLFVDRGTGTVLWRPCEGTKPDGAIQFNAKPSKSSNQVSNSFSGGIPTWQLTGGQFAADSSFLLPKSTDYISTIDIYLGFYGAVQAPLRFEYDVCYLPEDLCPYNDNDTEGLMGGKPDLLDFHNQYWINSLARWTTHPMNVQRGYHHGTQPVPPMKRTMFSRTAPRSIIQGPIPIRTEPVDLSLANSADVDTRVGGRYVYAKHSLKMNMPIPLAVQPRVRYTTSAVESFLGVTQTTDGRQDTLVNTSASNRCTPDASRRLFLVIRAADYNGAKDYNTGAGVEQNIAVNWNNGATLAEQTPWGTKINDRAGTGPYDMRPGVNVDFANSGSFDINIVKRCIRLE